MEELGVRPHHFDAGRMQHNGEFYDEISGRKESISLFRETREYIYSVVPGKYKIMHTK